MIRISTGLQGSGKTLHEVREMCRDATSISYYSNIETKDVKKNHLITKDMIFIKEVIDYKKNRKTGEETPIYEYRLNLSFWSRIPKPVSIVIDEAHEIVSHRESMSKRNKIMNSFVRLLRRVTQDIETGYQGELILISQNPYSIDKSIRELTTQIRHHTMYYEKYCLGCGCSWMENSNMPEKQKYCIACRKPDLRRRNYVLLIKFFDSFQSYDEWDFTGRKTYFKEIQVSDVEDYFGKYDTLQIKNFFDEIK